MAKELAKQYFIEKMYQAPAPPGLEDKKVNIPLSDVFELMESFSWHEIRLFAKWIQDNRKDLDMDPQVLCSSFTLDRYSKL